MIEKKKKKKETTTEYHTIYSDCPLAAFCASFNFHFASSHSSSELKRVVLRLAGIRKAHVKTNERKDQQCFFCYSLHSKETVDRTVVAYFRFNKNVFSY